jgi:DNA primase
MIADSTQERTPRYRGVSYVRPIDAAKEAVSVIDLADRLCGPGGLRRIGKEWVGRCALPDHEDRSPSFTVNADKNVWFCHGCLRGGDVVELARLAWGYDQREAHTAAAMLLMEFGHEVPQRPPAWFRKQERQAPVRQALEDAKIAHLQRHVFRRFMALLEAIEDDQERKAEAEHLWQAAREIAALIRAGRRAA